MNIVYFDFIKAFSVVSYIILLAKLVRYGLAGWTVSNKVNGKLSGLLILKDCNQ